MDIGHFIIIAMVTIMTGAAILAWALSRAASDPDDES
jgi:hypothetical protein